MKPYVKFVPAEQDAVAEVAASAQGAEAKIGDLSQLTTTAKTSLVATINEVAQSGGGAPTLKMRITSVNTTYDTIGFCVLSQYVTERNVEFSVEGEEIAYLDVTFVAGGTPPEGFVSTLQDDETGLYNATFDTAGLYLIDAYTSDSEPRHFTGLLCVVSD